MKQTETEDKMPAHNERFGVMAAEARRNGSVNLKVCTPQEVQWKPPLRQAATTLSASLGTAHRKQQDNQTVKNELVTN